MKTVWKFTEQGGNTVIIPGVPKVLSLVEFTNKDVTFWVEVNPDDEPIEYTFKVKGTGWPIDEDDSIYITSVRDGIFIWHFYLIP